jgi:zinc protease
MRAGNQRFARVALLIAASVFPWATQLIAAVDIQKWETSNGMRVLFVEANEIPMLQVSVAFAAGNTRDPEEKLGLSSLTSALLNDGAGDLDADQLAGALDSMGIEFGGASSRDMSRMTLKTLTDAPILERAVELFSSILSEPRFPEDALERERARALVGLQRHRQSPDSVAGEAFWAAMYPGHVYGRFGAGSEDTLASITRDDIVGFHQRYYVARNGVMVIVGDVDRSEAERIGNQVSQGISAGTPAEAIAMVEDGAASEQLIDFPSQQSHVSLGHPAIERGNEDYIPLYVGNYTLGGSSFVSLLGEEVRENRGLAYSVYSYMNPMYRRGPFVVGFQTRNDQRDMTIELAREIVTRYVEEGPTQEQLDAAKRHITGAFPLATDSNSKIAGFLLSVAFYNLPLDYLDTYIGRVEAVTVAQVQDVLQRYIHPNKFVQVVVGGPPE